MNPATLPFLLRFALAIRLLSSPTAHRHTTWGWLCHCGATGLSTYKAGAQTDARLHDTAAFNLAERLGLEWDAAAHRTRVLPIRKAHRIRAAAEVQAQLLAAHCTLSPPELHLKDPRDQVHLAASDVAAGATPHGSASLSGLLLLRLRACLERLPARLLALDAADTCHVQAHGVPTPVVVQGEAWPRDVAVLVAQASRAAFRRRVSASGCPEPCANGLTAGEACPSCGAICLESEASLSSLEGCDYCSTPAEGCTCTPPLHPKPSKAPK